MVTVYPLKKKLSSLPFEEILCSEMQPRILETAQIWTILLKW